MTAFFIIFGAPALKDGSPSGTLRRRVKGALSAAQRVKDRCFVATGGATFSGHVEAEIIKTQLIDAGITDAEILCDPESRDTYESVIRCQRLILGRGDVEWVAPCTSNYHVPRCAALLRIVGFRVRIFKMPSDWGKMRSSKILLAVSKEFFSTPYDIILLGFSMLRKRSR